MKVYIEPKFEGPDQGEGGIRRVVEAQHKYLPGLGVEVVDNVAACDVVSSHAMINARTDKPIVLTCHGLYWAEYEWPKWCGQANEQVLDAINKADITVAVSEWVAGAIERNTWVKPEVIVNGIDPLLWPVRAAGAGRREGPGYVLWNKTRVDPICETTSMQELARIARDVQFVSTFGTETDNVRLTGRLPFDKAQELIYNAGVYLCTTRETFGIGTLEAMAAGVPILGWDWGGQSEIIDHGKDGWLARPGDFVGLEKGLRYCLMHREAMGAAARDKVLSRYTWAQAMARYVAVYGRAISDRKNRLKVSVVVPCFNLGRFLGECIGSLADQPPVRGGSEVIIVDDASTDDSGTVADTLAAKYNNVRVVHNTTNQYLAGALNIGISAAKGEYIVPLDADNMLGKNILPVLCDALDKGDCDIAYGAMSVFGSDSNPGVEQVSAWPAQFDFMAQMTHHNQIPSTSAFRKRVWARVGGYRRRCRTAEDADFWCRATSYGARVKRATEAVVLRYRDRHDSMSRTVPDWPWNKWYAWHKEASLAPAISPARGKIWTFEPVKISVVIPVGPGHTRYVVDAVDSLVAQDFRAWEAIVINDSGEPLDWIHPFVRLHSTPRPGSGPAVARNIGIKAARGQTILPLDADDYLQPGALTALWEARGKLAAQGIDGYVYTDWIVQETGEIKESGVFDCETILHTMPHAVTALYNKSACEAVGGFDEHTETWEDWDFLIALAEQGTCGVRLPLPLFQYRMNGGTVREKLFADRAKNADNIKYKWGKYFRGEVKLMACKTCPGMGGGQQGPGPATRAAQTFTAEQVVAPPRGDLVLIEYAGRVSGPVTYRGKVTGTQYRFGLDPSHKIKYVHKDDAPFFLQIRDFRLGQPNVELLQAAGTR